MMITQEGRVRASYALQEAKRYDHDLEPKTFYANILYAPRRLIGSMSYSRLIMSAIKRQTPLDSHTRWTR
jgi:hypothetical protein